VGFFCAGKLRPNRDTDAFQVAQDVGGEKTQRAESLAREHAVADRVVACLRLAAVPRAVNLDDEALAVADEIQDVATERRLAAEMVAFGAQVPEEAPEQTLGRGGIAPKRPRAGDLGAPPTPALPTRGREIRVFSLPLVGRAGVGAFLRQRARTAIIRSFTRFSTRSLEAGEWFGGHGLDNQIGRTTSSRFAPPHPYVSFRMFVARRGV
jgi:hypothetical protein